MVIISANHFLTNGGSGGMIIIDKDYNYSHKIGEDFFLEIFGKINFFKKKKFFFDLFLKFFDWVPKYLTSPNVHVDRHT